MNVEKYKVYMVSNQRVIDVPVVCHGCENECFEPAHVFLSKDNEIKRAFVSCKERDDIGFVNIDFEVIKKEMNK